MDCEFCRPQYRLSLVQIASSGKVYFFDVTRHTVIPPLKALLQSEYVVKVFHDPREDLRKLRGVGIETVRVRDTQLQFAIFKQLQKGVYPPPVDPFLEGAARVSLSNLFKSVLPDLEVPEIKVSHYKWARRPLPNVMIAYAGLDVLHLSKAYYLIEEKISQTIVQIKTAMFASSDELDLSSVDACDREESTKAEQIEIEVEKKLSI